MPDDWFRCVGCDQKITGARTMIPYYRAQPGPQTTDVAVCAPCAAVRKPGETGRALARRLGRS